MKSLRKFPMVKPMKLEESTSGSYERAKNNNVDLRSKLNSKRQESEQKNIIRGFSNQSLIIPGSFLADHFDLKLTFVPKN